MKLQCVTVENWATFEKAELQFSEPGLTLIQGLNRTGKSSLVNAIRYLLFGSKTTISDAQPNAVPEDVATAILGFVHQSTAYSLVKGYKPKGRPKENVTLTAAGHPQQADASMFDQIVGLNPKVWAKIAFLSEGDLFQAKQHLIDLLDHFSDLLGLTGLTDAGKVLEAVEKELKKRRKSLQDAINEADADQEQDGGGADLESKKEKLESISKRVEALRKTRELLKSIRSLRNKQQSLLDERQDLVEKRKQLAKQFPRPAEADMAIRDAERKVESLEKQHHAVRQKRDIAIGELRQLESQNIKLKELVGSGKSLCPSCHQAISEDILGPILITKQAEVVEKGKECSQLANDEEKFEQQFKSKRAAFSNQKAEYDAYKRIIARLKDINSEMAEVVAQIGESTSEGMQAYDPDDVFDEVSQLEREKGELQTEIANAIRKRKALLETRDRFEAIQLRRGVLSLIHEAIVDLSNEKLESYLQSLADEIRSVWASSLELRKLWNIELDTDLALTFSEASQQLTMTSENLSSSERAFVYVALRAALIQTLPGLNFMILDDPFGSLDAPHRPKMLQLLKDISKKTQVVATTYDPELALDLDQQLHKRINSRNGTLSVYHL